MPTNKQASFRYRVLNDCFRRNRRWTLEELMAEVAEKLEDAFGVRGGVSKRTIQYDINLMRSAPPRGFEAPIECVDGRYYYGNRDFSIDKKPFSDKDLAVLREALSMLAQFKGLPHVQALRGLLDTFEGWARYPNRALIQFETNDQTAGLEWMGPIYQAAAARQALHIRYHPFSAQEPYDLVLHPYLLREYRNRWFVFGLHDTLGEITTLALDRIRQVRPDTALPFRPDDRFDPNTWFRDIVGVTRPRDEAPADMRLRTTPLLAKYLQTKPIHHSQQKVSETDDGVEFSLRVIPNYELFSELMRYGKALEVLGPPAVVERFRGF